MIEIDTAQKTWLSENPFNKFWLHWILSADVKEQYQSSISDRSIEKLRNLSDIYCFPILRSISGSNTAFRGRGANEVEILTL